MQQALILDEAQLRELIKECVKQGITEYFSYPSSSPRTIDDKKLLTRKQAAEYLCCTPNTVSRYVRQGKLMRAIVFGKYRFFESDLLKFINSRRA